MVVAQGGKGKASSQSNEKAIRLMLAAEAVMDAHERFQKVVVPNYNRFITSPNDFSLLENLIRS